MGIVDRRQFITAGAVVVLSSTLSLRAQGTKAKRVIIAGGGLAGLSCAYELQKGGFEVVVLEGNGQPGGRVHTFREGFAPGIDGETGAYRIPDTHELTMSSSRIRTSLGNLGWTWFGRCSLHAGKELCRRTRP
jgi:monoamine oxidase